MNNFEDKFKSIGISEIKQSKEFSIIENATRYLEDNIITHSKDKNRQWRKNKLEHKLNKKYLSPYLSNQRLIVI